MEDIINIQYSLINNVKGPPNSWVQNFHMTCAVYFVIAKHDFRKAKNEIDILDKNVSKNEMEVHMGLLICFY